MSAAAPDETPRFTVFPGVAGVGFEDPPPVRIPLSARETPGSVRAPGRPGAVSGIFCPRDVERSAHPVLAVDHQMPVRPQHQRGVLMAEVLGHRDHGLARGEEHAGEVVAQCTAREVRRQDQKACPDRDPSTRVCVQPPIPQAPPLPAHGEVPLSRYALQRTQTR